MCLNSVKNIKCVFLEQSKYLLLFNFPYFLLKIFNICVPYTIIVFLKLVLLRPSAFPLNGYSGVYILQNNPPPRGRGRGGKRLFDKMNPDHNFFPHFSILGFLPTISS